MALVLTFMHLYTICYLQLSLSILFVSFSFLSGIETPDSNGQWCQHLLTLFANKFYKRHTKGTNFRIMFIICFTFVHNVHVLFSIQCVRFELVESPEVTLCGLTGL